MARKDKPYLPLYVQDFMTDEKLMECSALATGVYVRIMCVLHKCDPYGKLLLKQKDKQSDKQINNFATKLLKHLPYSFDVIVEGLGELLGEGCLIIDGDYILQKRMVNDGELSTVRSLAGSEGGKKSVKSKDKFAQAKVQANTDIDNDILISNTLTIDNGTWESEKRQFRIAEQWQMKQCTEFNISKEQVLESIERFLKELDNKEDYKDLKELKKHWYGWFKFNKNKPPKQPELSDYQKRLLEQREQYKNKTA
jgi:hypothetical protein